MSRAPEGRASFSESPPGPVTAHVAALWILLDWVRVGGPLAPSLTHPCLPYALPEQGPWGTEEGLPPAGGGVRQPPGPWRPLRAEPPGRPEEDPSGLATEHLLARQEGADSRGPALPEGGTSDTRRGPAWRRLGTSGAEAALRVLTVVPRPAAPFEVPHTYREEALSRARGVHQCPRPGGEGCGRGACCDLGFLGMWLLKAYQDQGRAVWGVGVGWIHCLGA